MNDRSLLSRAKARTNVLGEHGNWKNFTEMVEHSKNGRTLLEILRVHKYSFDCMNIHFGKFRKFNYLKILNCLKIQISPRVGGGKAHNKNSPGRVRVCDFAREILKIFLKNFESNRKFFDSIFFIFQFYFHHINVAYYKQNVYFGS